ncbi:MAG: Beta-lactamase [Pedosphaera sp.]|nr:Beta-lactamase [Pedosphaera sp.]
MTHGENLELVREKTESHLREILGCTRGAMGLMALDLTTGEKLGINDHLVFPQASAIKIPVLMEVYKQASEGKFKLTDLRRIEKQDKAGGSGVLFELGDGTVQMSLHDLCILMITVSDNTAMNMLIDLVGIANVNQTLASLGLKQTRLQRRMIDTAASLRGEENLSTPFEAARIMEILYKGEFINRTICDDILSILKKHKSTGISSGLPAEIPIASKPGGLAGVATEWAIVFLPNRPYILVIMENYGIAQEASQAMKDISKTLYDYYFRLSRATSHGIYIAPPSAT